MNDEHQRWSEGQYKVAERWFRVNATDIAGRPDPLLAEMASGKTPLPWLSSVHQRNGLAAVASVGVSFATQTRLRAHILATSHGKRKWRMLPDFAYVGACPIFHSGRAVWIGLANHPAFWLDTIDAFMERRAEGEPAVPFLSAADQSAWLDAWPKLEEHAESEGSKIDLAAAYRAIKQHPFLAVQK